MNSRSLGDKKLKREFRCRDFQKAPEVREVKASKSKYSGNTEHNQIVLFN